MTTFLWVMLGWFSLVAIASFISCGMGKRMEESSPVAGLIGGFIYIAMIIWIILLLK